MNTNCVNCGAPIDRKLNKCPYCGTPYDYSGFSASFENALGTISIAGKEYQVYLGKCEVNTINMGYGGYVKFDFNGKRYIYYNCFVESIADID